MADRSRMNREAHVRICEGLGVKFPRATRLLNFRIKVGTQNIYLFFRLLAFCNINAKAKHKIELTIFIENKSVMPFGKYFTPIFR